MDHLDPQPGPVLDVELTQLAVSLHLGLAPRDLLHEGGQLHGLADQGPADGPEVSVGLRGGGEVMPVTLEWRLVSGSSITRTMPCSGASQRSDGEMKDN